MKHSPGVCPIELNLFPAFVNGYKGILAGSDWFICL
jgi:hypothetical protein